MPAFRTINPDQPITSERVIMKHRLQIVALFGATVALMQTGCDSSTGTKHFADENWSQADLFAGGQLYDKWWAVTGGATPTTDFDPIWSSQTTNTRSGGDTWRCKECHGWDYVGKDGRYSSGSHFTGFDGLWTTRLVNRKTVFNAIKDEGGNHDLTGVLSDNDVLDLTKFIIDGLVDMGLYIDSGGIATGDTLIGAPLYAANCSSCHGADGLTLDFSSDLGIQGVGFLANDNPQESLHKIRWGHPGTSMPSMVEAGLTDQQMGDLLAFIQTLPQP